MSRLTGTAPRTVPGIVMLGFPIDGRPLFASAPCATYINFSWPMVNVAAITSPTWSSNLPIPRDAQLRGRHVTVQAFFVYGTPIMAGTSNAVRLVLGD